MSFLRKSVKAVSGFFFTILFISTLLLFNLYQFTEYNNLKSVLIEFFSQSIQQKSQINQTLSVLKEKCSSVETIEANFSGQIFVINCTEIRAAQQNFEVMAASMFNEIYYKKYECDLLSCLQQGQENFIVLISTHANNYFKNLFYVSLAGTIIFATIFFVSIETWPRRLKNFGTTFIFIGIPFFILDYLKSLFINKYLPAEISTMVLPIINKLFSSISTVYLIVLSLGIVLAVAGYLIGRKSKKK